MHMYFFSRVKCKYLNRYLQHLPSRLICIYTYYGCMIVNFGYLYIHICTYVFSFICSYLNVCLQPLLSFGRAHCPLPRRLPTPERSFWTIQCPSNRYTYVWMFMYIFEVYIHTYFIICVCMYVCMSTLTYVYKHLHIYVLVCICLYINLCTGFSPLRNYSPEGDPDGVDRPAYPKITPFHSTSHDEVDNGEIGEVDMCIHMHICVYVYVFICKFVYFYICT
jgi:hypothetical protein